MSEEEEEIKEEIKEEEIKEEEIKEEEIKEEEIEEEEDKIEKEKVFKKRLKRKRGKEFVKQRKRKRKKRKKNDKKFETRGTQVNLFENNFGDIDFSCRDDKNNVELCFKKLYYKEGSDTEGIYLNIRNLGEQIINTHVYTDIGYFEVLFRIWNTGAIITHKMIECPFWYNQKYNYCFALFFELFCSKKIRGFFSQKIGLRRNYELQNDKYLIK